MLIVAGLHRLLQAAFELAQLLARLITLHAYGIRHTAIRPLAAIKSGLS
jgi:hypothetical protein